MHPALEGIDCIKCALDQVSDFCMRYNAISAENWLTRGFVLFLAFRAPPNTAFGLTGDNAGIK